MRRALALAFCLGVSFSAHATLITIDPDDYAPGTDLSHIAPGLTLQSLWQANTYGTPNANPFYAPVALPVVAANCNFNCSDIDGVLEFGTQRPTGSISAGFYEIGNWSGCVRGTEIGIGSTTCRYGFTVLEMTFENPTDFLQLETAWGSDPASIIAFNSAGERLFWCTASGSNRECEGNQILSEGLGSYSSTFIIDREAGDIARVIFGGMMGTASIASITYNVPEPGTLALFSLGLWGLSLARRRRS